MSMKNLVLKALENLAPKLLAELKSSNSLDQYLQTTAEEISSQIVSLTMEIAKKNGLDKAESLQELAGILASADQAAAEIVLSQMLEFPQDEISQPKQDATTSLQTQTSTMPDLG